MSPATVLALRPQVDSGRTDTLAKLEHASVLLQEVRTIQDAKQIHDVVKAAAVYAREHGLGRIVVQRARAVTLEALRRIGELLSETDRAVGGRLGAITPSHSEGVIPTLASLGVTYKISLIARRLFNLPLAVFEDVRDGRRTLDQVLAEEKRAKDEQAHIDLIAQGVGPSAAALHVCSVGELFASGIAPDAVVTAPWWCTSSRAGSRKEFFGAYTEVARACRDVRFVAVKVVNVATQHLDEILDRLREHLTYREVFTVDGLTLVFSPDADARALMKARDLPAPRPSSWYRPYESWEQCFIQRLTEPGAVLCDPFLRAETAIAALEFGRRFVGCSCDAGVVADTRRRIGAAQ